MQNARHRFGAARFLKCNTKQKALLGGSAFCIEGWESINKFGVIKFSSFSILLLLYLSKEESGKMLNKNIYKRKNSLYN